MALFDRFKKKAEEVTDEVMTGQAGGEVTAPSEPEAETPVVEEAAPAPASVDSPHSGEYRTVRVKPGMKGWGNGWNVTPVPGKDLIYSVTGGGIHPVAQRIADLTGGKAFDGFKSKAGFDEIAVAVIDCGGTARIGVYPMKGVLTIDVHGASPSGPLMKFINEENFVSGVTVDDIEVVED